MSDNIKRRIWKTWQQQKRQLQSQLLRRPLPTRRLRRKLQQKQQLAPAPQIGQFAIPNTNEFDPNAHLYAQQLQLQQHL